VCFHDEDKFPTNSLDTGKFSDDYIKVMDKIFFFMIRWLAWKEIHQLKAG